MSVEALVGLTTAQLGAVTKMDRTRWSRYDNGQMITEQVLWRIAQAIEVPVWEALRLVELRRQRKGISAPKLL